jgi:ligand-binding SRPBCC domain-containing protein
MNIKFKEWETFIPRPLNEVWHFFSRPENLDAITPEDMSFQILTQLDPQQPMYQGMIIQYKVSPFPGVKMDWTTEITHVRDGVYFIDEQRFGPYALWHHQHHFAEKDNGVLMKDILHYKVPYGFIGTIADRLFVAQRIEQIFSYRETAIRKIFNF